MLLAMTYSVKYSEGRVCDHTDSTENDLILASKYKFVAPVNYFCSTVKDSSALLLVGLHRTWSQRVNNINFFMHPKAFAKDIEIIETQ